MSNLLLDNLIAARAEDGLYPGDTHLQFNLCTGLTPDHLPGGNVYRVSMIVKHANHLEIAKSLRDMADQIESIGRATQTELSLT